MLAASPEWEGPVTLAQPARASLVAFEWPALPNEHGGQMLWFASWIVGPQGEEAEWFYSGRGGEHTLVEVPPQATGVRIRRWPTEGFSAEYVDLHLEGLDRVYPEHLDFDVRQDYSLLAED